VTARPAGEERETGTEREKGTPPALELELERNVEAPAIARAAVSGRFQGFALSGSLCYTLALLVSELVSNAVRHSEGSAEAPIVLSATVTNETIRVTVTDAGRGFTPSPRDPAGTQGGFGLQLLETAAARWGVDSGGPTRVWFELPRSG
jgi:anti-sigma regulatory factor (Ser/Thr protein kinase)